MADPRKAVSFEGIGVLTATFKHNGSIVFDAAQPLNSAQAGRAVKIVSNDTVALVGDGERVLGKLLRVEPDGFCTVQIGGGCTLPGGDGATLTAGTRIMGDLGAAAAAGFIQTEADATPNVGSGLIYSSADTAAVQVML
jgi:hypothetical protein